MLPIVSWKKQIWRFDYEYNYNKVVQLHPKEIMAKEKQNN